MVLLYFNYCYYARKYQNDAMIKKLGFPSLSDNSLEFII